MKKNDEIILDIEDLSEDGAGIGRFEGMVFFVKGGVPGDRIRAGITALKKTHGFARIIEIQKASVDRTEPKCPVAGKCGGCSIMHISYDAQLRYKEKKVKDAFVRIGGFQEDEIQKAMRPIIGMHEPFYYRNKSQYPISSDESGNIRIGFYAPRSHRIVETNSCIIGQSSDSRILSTVKDWMLRNRIPAYDEIRHKGLIRHVIIRHAVATGQIMVCIVSSKQGLSNVSELVEGLKEATEEKIKSVVVNINPNKGNVILGAKSIAVFGDDYITDKYSVEYGGEELSYCVNISSQSFYQVNPTQMSKLYSKALEYASLTGSENVWDLYCGIGTITFALSGNAKQVMGIEAVPQAIENAKENAKLNNILNTTFYCGNAEDVLEDAESFGEMSHPDVVVVDPPRAGCDAKALDSIIKANPKRIVYVSCNPSTLARDAKYLCEGGYTVDEITPVDQFCHGMHVEVVVKMSRVE